MRVETQTFEDRSNATRNIYGGAKLSNVELGLAQELLRKAHYHAKGAQWAPGPPELIIEGWVLHYRTVSDSRRQVFDILLPGDIIEQVNTELRPAGEFLAVTPVRTVVLAADSCDPELTNILEDLRPHREQRLLDQIFRLGTLDAYERTVHLLMDIYRRSGIEGVLDANSVQFPLTHLMLADSLGLSVVHVERILTRLRVEEILAVQSGHLVIFDPDAIRALEARWIRSL